MRLFSLANCLAGLLMATLAGAIPATVVGANASGNRNRLPDTAPPTVSSTVPSNGATSVAIDQVITATFNEAMDPARVTHATFDLLQGSHRPVKGTVTYAGMTATFTPAENLAPNTLYTARIKRGARDLAGNPLASNFFWSFTTGATTDATRPTVSFTVPVNEATGVAINQAITTAFSEAMDPSTISTSSFTLHEGLTAVTGTVSYAGVTATFTPASNLSPL
ncbi:MAG TPA: Ig-like domain-containing protein, partial [Candidatus Krumholzibacteria bacterium]|nr:Ig-like domain-containing protein [Candidatus Krumholzibacteria bacterium]